MSRQDHAEVRRGICAFVARAYGHHGRAPRAADILRERQFVRIQASVEELDDEIYEAAVNGRTARASYLEFVRERIPSWLAAGEERSRNAREAR